MGSQRLTPSRGESDQGVLRWTCQRNALLPPTPITSAPVAGATSPHTSQRRLSSSLTGWPPGEGLGLPKPYLLVSRASGRLLASDAPCLNPTPVIRTHARSTRVRITHGVCRDTTERSRLNSVDCSTPVRLGCCAAYLSEPGGGCHRHRAAPRRSTLGGRRMHPDVCVCCRGRRSGRVGGPSGSTLTA